MRASTRRILSIGLAGIFLIGAFFTYANFIRGEMDIVNEKRATLATKEELFTNQNDAINKIDGTFTKFKTSQDTNKKKIELTIPNGVNTIGALRQVEAISKRSSATITALGFKEAGMKASESGESLKKIGILEITTDVTGSYAGLKDFVRLIETNVRIANVQSFNYKSSFIGGQKQAGSPEQLNLKVEMYYQE